ncbi:ABC transporter permease [Sphingomonas canadensis]|uniref:ABC transporter permease n=1 Tax=Sphingomonas canadensis TaxID=1219257 RepID=A0ABW3H8P4_9SPHN|nr:ABC transporter permease [Sphingomonas canadensis]MCW3836223.1 ABC transporter permease [Sphingomonas canadensis]
MLGYALRRVAASVPVAFCVALFVFALLYLAPGDPAALMAGDAASPADIEKLRAALGLDRPFLTRFVEWLWRILHGDLGTSVFTGIPVATLIGQRVLATFSLMIVALLIASGIGVPMGALAAYRPGGAADRAVMVGGVLGFSVPVFVTGYLLSYIFAYRLGWFAVQGFVSPFADFGGFLRTILLPAASLAGAYAALIARITRATMLDVLAQDHVRTARAKGLGEARVVIVHGLSNAAAPILTVMGMGAAVLLGGAVVTETVFGIPGLGRLTVDAVLRRDYPVIQGVTLFLAFIFVAVNLGVDLLCAAIDPRVRQ